LPAACGRVAGVVIAEPAGALDKPRFRGDFAVAFR
jgi:hypothetical protein